MSQLVNRPARMSIALFLFAAIMPGVDLAVASTIDGQPKILLHVRPITVKNPCQGASLARCQDAVTGGMINVPYHVFVLAALGDSILHAGEGGATLEFTQPNPVWPSPGGGTIITWDAVNNCQTGEVAVAGYFYMTAYDPATMRIIPRPVDQISKVASCGSFETILSYYNDLGCAYFAQGGIQGCNPCIWPCFVDPVEPTTWSRIKANVTGGR
ncbi:MAG: hypothetical protein FD129_658 [bacterium]|nr:MAG: hypothetical protein FD129_658 [bacterium]